MNRPSSPSIPQLRVLALTATMATMAIVASALAWPHLSEPRSDITRALPLYALFLCYLAFEPVRLHLHVRRFLQHAQTVTFDEVPLALGLLLVAPRELLVVGIAAPVLINAWRRMTPLKQAFNAANRLLEVVVALTVYSAVAPEDSSSTSAWLAVCLAVACSGVLTALCVVAAISLSTRRIPWEDLRGSLVSAAPVSAFIGTLGFVAALVWQAGASGTVPLVVCLALLVLGLRGFSVLTERHRDLVALHGWSQRLTAEADVDVVLGRVLDAAVDLLDATEATILVQDTAAATWTTVDRGPDGGIRRTKTSSRGNLPAAGVDRAKAALNAVAPLARGHTMVLTVAGRPRSLRPFRDEDARLLDMVADQSALALRNGQLIERLRQDALHDALTDLPNRAALVEALSLRAADPGGSQVLWLGLRDQQVVNEALGYDSGDELLRQVAGRLRAAAGSGALVARVDGDEFAVLAPCTAPDTWGETATGAIADCFTRPFTLFGVQVAVRASLGQSGPARPGVDTALHLLRQADTAMRAARRSGHDLERYSPALETGTADRLALVVDLQRGIGRDELVLYAQPQVRLGDGAVIGVEALVRWQHPTLGLLPPGVFLPLAEKTRLDEPLTQWVLDAALHAVADWRRSGLDLTVAVNVPARAVSDPRLCHSVAAALSRHEVPGRCLVIEITESGLLDNPTGAAEVLTELASLGITVSVDDFGTGFSSLSHLKRLPVDEIKIDRSFVSSMLTDQDDAAIVRSVIELAANLGLACVAEGIEDQATYDVLRGLGCSTAQGYLMAAPMPVEDIPAWIAGRALPRGGITTTVPAPRAVGARPPVASH